MSNDTKIVATMSRNGLKMESNREEVAMALKTWRLRNGLRQVDVAKRFGLSRYTILRVEKTQPISWEMTYRVFAALSKELAKENGFEQNS